MQDITDQIRDLKALFPEHEPGCPRYVADSLNPGEQIVWYSKPARWGHIYPLPVVAGSVIAIGILIAVSINLEGLLSGTSHLLAMLGLIIVNGAVACAFLARDPRKKWDFVVTNQRLLTFFKGHLLRETGPGGTLDLRVYRRRADEYGDVIWKRVTDNAEGTGTQPDGGRIGFIGVPEPAATLRRLQAWRDRLLADADQEARAFADQAQTSSDPSAPSPGEKPQREVEETENGTPVPAPAGITMHNDKFGFSITLPSSWNGETTTQKPRKVLGVTVFDLDKAALTEMKKDWTELTATNSANARLEIWVKDGPPKRNYEQMRSDVASTKIGRNADDDILLESSPELKHGLYSGFSLAYSLPGATQRVVVLANDSHHLTFQLTVDRDQGGDLSRALDAIVDSLTENSAV